MPEWRISAISYNVNGRRPVQEDVRRWLESEKGLAESELVCFAMQEISHAEMLAAVPQCSTWTDQLNEWMGEHGYVLVHRLCLASNLLLVYSVHRLLQWIHQLDTRWSRNSFGGVAGYKGTISVRLLFKNEIASLTFMTSHFFHGERHSQKRIQQYHRSLSCTFNDDSSKTPGLVLWLGDLNSRLENLNMSNSEFIQKIKECGEGELKQIFQQHDQLTKSKRENEAFTEFQEHTVNFKPTYRVLVGNREYDSQRLPAWCDRVLYKSTNGSDIQVQHYSSSQQITLSDHFPVSSVLQIKIPASPQNLEWDCHFEHIPTWSQHIPLVCRFSFTEDFWQHGGSYWDWLGIYPSNSFVSVSKPIHYVYMITCYTDSNQENAKNVAEFPPLQPGTYRVGYFSYSKACLHGLSEEFKVDEHLG